MKRRGKEVVSFLVVVALVLLAVNFIAIVGGQAGVPDLTPYPISPR